MRIIGISKINGCAAGLGFFRYSKDLILLKCIFWVSILPMNITIAATTRYQFASWFGLATPAKSSAYRLLLVLLLALIFGPASGQQGRNGASEGAPLQKTPPWAYPVLPSTAPPAFVDDGIKHQLDGSKYSFTRTELIDLFTAHDWFPGAHPEMPEVVVHGRKPEVRACGMCHYPNGQGRPENAALAGLPASYIVQQVHDYQAGHRRSSEAQTGPHLRMLAAAVNLSEDELKAAAEYFSSQKYKPWIKVIETDQVPLTRVATGSMWAAIPGDAKEPIGNRIVEVPNDYSLTELRDPRSGFTAYVPIGSINRGQKIATIGNGKTNACIACHGADLRGTDAIPPLAGRSTQYLFRQLYDMRNGSRSGAGAVAMRDVVANLSLDDMTAVVAYAASLEP